MAYNACLIAIADFDYCLQMALSSLTKEKVDAIRAQRDGQEAL